MKRVSEIVLFGFLAIVGFAGVWLLRSHLHLSSFSQSSEKTDGSLSTSSSDVRVKPPQEVAWTNAYGQTGVNYGDQVYVGADSEAKLDLPDLELEIQQGSLLTILKSEETSNINIAEGRASFTLSQGKSVGVSVGNEKLQISGDEGSKLELTRQNDAGTSTVGFSVTQGTSSIALPNGKSFKGEAGSSFVAKQAAGAAFELATYEIKSILPQKNSAFLAKQTVNLRWKTTGTGLTDLKLVISKDRNFKNIVATYEAKGSQINIQAPNEPGDYYWAVTADASGIEIFGEKRKFAIIELRALNIIDPIFEFKKPGVWGVKAVLEEMDLASNYRIQVDDTADFSSPFIDENSKTNIAALMLEKKQGLVYVRARPEYATIREHAPWSDVVTFNVPEPPGTPTLQALATGSRAFTVSWDKTKNTDSYVVELSERSDFRSAESLKSEVNEANVTCLRNRPRFARANSHQNNGVYGLWSDPILLQGCVEPLTFESSSITPPYLPRFKRHLFSKLDFTWKGDTLGKDVTIEISKDPSFKKSVRLKTKSAQISRELPDRGTHYVRAIQNLKADSYITQFSKVLKVEETPFADLKVPTLTSPPLRETFFMQKAMPISVVLKWDQVPDARGFDVQVSREADFKDVLLEKTIRLAALRLNQSITDSGTYYWRVRSYHEHALSGWSEPRSFAVVYAK